MKKTFLITLLCLLQLIAAASSHGSKVSQPIIGVQLWDGGPWWASTNVRTDVAQFNFAAAEGQLETAWRLPSEAEFEDLKSKCSWTWDSKPGNEGFLVTGPNGNSIFFPAEGYLSRGINPHEVGGVGHYWTSGHQSNPSQGKEWYMNEYRSGFAARGKDNALSLRPVCDSYSPLMATVYPCNDFTGRGNGAERFLDMKTMASAKSLKPSVTVSVEAPSEAVSSLRLMSGGKTLCTVDYAGPASYKLSSKKKVAAGENIQVCADIREDAPEGSMVKVSLASMEADGIKASLFGNMESSREVLLTQKCLYRPGDYGSRNWRIPAVRQLSDGTLLAVNDRRNETENDLPGRIDVVYSYSTDKGRTWSEPGYIARNFGFMHGYGDPALVECEDGTVICFFAGGETFSRSNLEDPQRSFFAVSKDFGRTWSEPVEITSQIWGPEAVNPFCQRYHSSFFSSGNALILTSGEHKGRILVANVTCYNGWAGMCNHAVYSDDCGKTWNVSGLAFPDKGDEAKMVQLTDGSILMSVRQNGDRAFSISHDSGETWTESGAWPEMHVTACNGDMIRFDSKTLLHTVPDSMNRENVTVFVSHDDGKTWPYKKVICHGPSQYSSITVLSDGTIGVYYEKNAGNAELWFENFSIGWLLSK